MISIEYEKEIKRRIGILKQIFPHIEVTPEYGDTYFLKCNNLKEQDHILLTKNDMRVVKKNLVPELMEDVNNTLNKHPIILPIGIHSFTRPDSSKYSETDFNINESFYKISSSKVTKCLLEDVINFLVLHSIGTYDFDLIQEGVFVLTPYADKYRDLGLNYESITEQLVTTQINNMNGGLKGRFESHGDYKQREIEAALQLKTQPNGKERKLYGKRIY